MTPLRQLVRLASYLETNTNMTPLECTCEGCFNNILEQVIRHLDKL